MTTQEHVCSECGREAFLIHNPDPNKNTEADKVCESCNDYLIDDMTEAGR